MWKGIKHVKRASIINHVQGSPRLQYHHCNSKMSIVAAAATAAAAATSPNPNNQKLNRQPPVIFQFSVDFQTH